MARNWIIIPALSVLILSSCTFSTREKISIMTFNVRYGTANDGENAWVNRKGIFLEVLKKHKPDILGVQEALAFQVEAIKSEFPEWQSFGVGRYHGVEIPSRPHENKSGESCIILYDQTRFKLLSQGTFWHSDFPDSAGSITWGNTLPRITTWGIFQIKSSHKKLVIMNTHFHWGEPYVENTTRLMVTKWHEIAGDLPTIIIGDFNLPPASATHDALCGQDSSSAFQGRFVDCWQALNKPEADVSTGHGFTGKGGNRIDWILTSPEFQTKNCEIVRFNVKGHYPSDHFPVIAKLLL
jgi:endonuclease/exonuclease/phosphatase family metal-dependent hydrolase